MPDPPSTDVHTSRPPLPGESAAARDARALLDASDAEAPRAPQNRLDAVQNALKRVWDAVNEQQAEIDSLREQLAEAQDAAEHARAEQKAAETKAAEAVAALSTEIRDRAERIALLEARESRRKKEVQALRDEMEAARDEVTRTAQRAARLEVARAVPPPALDEAPRQTRRPEPAVPPPPARETVTLEALYRAFCRDAGGLNSNPELFATSLRAAFPTAEVRTVYRDADSPARPIVLTAERRGNSAVPFWAVSVDGHHGLVPQPMGADQFRELAPCFTGQAAPASLAEIDPAPLTTFGAGFELTRPGRVA